MLGLGWTPLLFVWSGDAFVVAFVPPQPVGNFEPPAFDDVFADEFDCVLDCACSAALACAEADAFAFGPAAEFEADASSDFFAWPLFSAEAEAEAETLALAEACAA